MEQDIEILERMLKIEKECLHYDVSQDEIRAIEHLIKAYKEQNNIIKTANIAIKDLQQKLENSIPVSLVEETIEELKQYKLSLLKENYVENQKEFKSQNVLVCNAIRDIAATGKIDILQELLEKRK